ncbi:DNA topoisomerase IB [Brevundimonas nasdae]|uniref:DNA topoisomerase IB n=1 Tax=Brevundimonas nasdae TaxID=172043 RepID=A0ABX8THV9_9CAUL|nr:DNA topoisomerase IB [Brevundimonas nasdae]QYC10821.1 DNA topoisomerase IB [Brevundimonas nasdae]QYC13608.1 DNA topoisomerase IB [Brevundimonas nasdae]
MGDGSQRFDVAVEVPPGLSWCSDDNPGLSRRRAGKGWSYRDAKGQVVNDARVLARIRALAIPPAWTDVWICPRANGHIQATGRDVKGRKQYRYHADWSTARSENKFDRLPAFCRALPKLHAQIEHDLGLRGVCKPKVLATAVRLLEITLIRVGNAEYARQNRSYGLTTLHKRHLDVDGAALTFEFRGKSGKDHCVSVNDRRLARILRALEDLPGQQLFKYRAADGDLCPITSDDVNAYIHAAMGEQFSAKDFRTWAGTVSAARALRVETPPTSPTDARRTITRCIKAVSGLLGNTPAVCRSSYIHPRVFDLFEAGLLAEQLPGPNAQAFERTLVRVLSRP